MAIDVARLTARAVSTAHRVMGGVPITYVRTTPGTVDPVTDIETGAVMQSYTPRAIVEAVDNAAGDTPRRRLFIGALDIPLVPSIGDVVTALEGADWRVESEPVIVAPTNGAAAAYIVTVIRMAER